MLRVCIASIQNVERSLLLLVVLASDIPLRTIKSFSLLFAVLVHAAGRHKQTFTGASLTVLSTLYGRRELFLSLHSSHVQQSIHSKWCVADCVIYSASSSVNVFGTSHVQQSSIASY